MLCLLIVQIMAEGRYVDNDDVDHIMVIKSVQFGNNSINV